MRQPDAAQTGGGGYNIRTSHREDGQWEASVAVPDIAPVVAAREVEAIRQMTKVLDTHVHGEKGRLA